MDNPLKVPAHLGDSADGVTHITTLDMATMNNVLNKKIYF